jgi:hypothetical protein
MSREVHSVRDHGALWQLLSAMRIEGASAERSFEQALAEENGWSLERALQVSREYRRFLFLAAGGGPELTPSRAVDKAWHLHLTYSRHYWDVLCKEILGKPLHHEPGGAAQATTPFMPSNMSALWHSTRRPSVPHRPTYGRGQLPPPTRRRKHGNGTRVAAA